MKKMPLILFIIFLVSCDANTIDKERLSISENDSYIAYVAEPEMNALVPTVNLTYNFPEKDLEPFLVEFEVVSDELKPHVTINKSIDSRNAVDEKLKDQVQSGEKFYLGASFPLKNKITADKLKKMNGKENMKITVTELDGDIITSGIITNFYIGKRDGTLVEL